MLKLLKIIKQQAIETKLDIQETFLIAEILSEVFYKNLCSTTWSIHSISANIQIRFNTNIISEKKTKIHSSWQTWNNQTTWYMLVLSYLHFYDLAKVMASLLGLHIELVENGGQIQEQKNKTIRNLLIMW